VIIALLVATAIAGHPTTVTCDTSGYPGPAPPPGFQVEAWTAVGSKEIHLAPFLCSGLDSPLGSAAFARSIGVLIHESAHARGIRTEDCAELWGNLVVFDVLRRFYGVPFFSRLSLQVAAQVRNFTLVRPTSYQPKINSCST
jgi:hypothetical protein